MCRTIVNQDVGSHMKLLSLAGSSYLTGTAIADAVLTSGLVLARRREMDLVCIPFRDGDDLREVEFTIGWMCDVVGISSISPGDELLDSDALTRVRAMAGVAEPDYATMFWSDFDQRDING